MKLPATEHPRLTVSAFLVFVLIHAMQFGPEYVSMSIKPIRWAGQDVWISAILSGLSISAVIWLMYQILDRCGTDLIHIHRRLFGRWAGSGLNLVFIVYFLLLACFQLRLFIEVIQVWLFADLATWPLALVLLVLAYYIVSGGFRVVVGICMFSLIRYVTIFAMFFPAIYFHFNNLTPAFDHSPSEILQASKAMTFPYLGAESLLFCYTFIKSPEKSQKWAHWANALTTFSFLLILFFSLLLFKPEQLSFEVWPQLTKYKFIQFPFIDRFEYIGATAQILWVIPIICFCLWASSRIGKIMLGVRQTAVLPFLSLIVFAAVCLIPDRPGVERLQAWLDGFGFCLTYAYIPLVYLVVLVRVKARTAA
ncbi:GerAB/ArcD/ProY family transporter [Paenibacillus sacheonensis]|uniref:GerAB/ArcD/ProY family transporter n=1 Tax=Paenibacillus sacheonensis TaxID=742054 RepID=A0A7X4YSR2_9BACL|nr:GerAB/ArcD/ProY family transporter [Paenibacillus sacheonensis]MBM7568165.1 spore germination protein (amino acid permease) [Paenibacillus sacheonensis]NBC71833.1 GerAB/ArcD/ProY family transporter [Paenibacillus sacheonensis]